MQSEHITQLMDFLKRDQTSPYPKYPIQAIDALKDERVVGAVAERLQKNGTLTNITALSYSFSTGLLPICFEFTGPGIAGLGATALLVLLDYRHEVVGMIDPFDPAQPNPKLPPLPKAGEQPFVLSQPSAAGDAIVSVELLHPQEVRTREFFRKLGMPKGVQIRAEKQPSDDFPDGGDSGDGGGGGGVGTVTGIVTATTTRRAVVSGSGTLTFVPDTDLDLTITGTD